MILSDQPKRLTIRECRKSLGGNCSRTEAEIELLRDQLYMFADIVFTLQENYYKRQRPTSQHGIEPLSTASSNHWHYLH